MVVILILIFSLAMLPAMSHAKYGKKLYKAASKGDLARVSTLLEKGAEVDYRDKRNSLTPLVIASTYGYAEITNALLEAGAEVNLRTRGGHTALHSASGNGNFEVVQVLLSAGADITIQDSGGYTALLSASIGENIEIVQALHAAGADINHQRHKDGKTPLMVASEAGQPEIVRFLLEAGADVRLRDSNGSTAYEIVIAIMTYVANPATSCATLPGKYVLICEKRQENNRPIVEYLLTAERERVTAEREREKARQILSAKESGYWYGNKQKSLSQVAVLLTSTINGRLYIEGINDQSEGIEYEKYRWIYLPPGTHTIHASFGGNSIELEDTTTDSISGFKMQSMRYRSFAMPVKGDFESGQVYLLNHRAVRRKAEEMSAVDALFEDLSSSESSDRKRFKRDVGDILPELKNIEPINSYKKQVGTIIDNVEYYPSEWEEL